MLQSLADGIRGDFFVSKKSPDQEQISETTTMELHDAVLSEIFIRLFFIQPLECGFKDLQKVRLVCRRWRSNVDNVCVRYQRVVGIAVLNFFF